MISELGLVYFLLRAASRNTVKVWPVSRRIHCGRAAAYLERDLVRRRRACLYARDGAPKELLRVLLHMQHLVGWHPAQHALEPRMVGPVEEELLPEALGELRVLVVLLSWRSVQRAGVGGGHTHAEEGFVEVDDFGLEGLLRDLREGRRLHRGLMVRGCSLGSGRDAARKLPCRVVVLSAVSAATCAPK
jgi:hypothetical protein